jgi:uncharacterized membrane protein YecN with MAPEG domain
MVKTSRKLQHEAWVAEDKKDTQRQSTITLWIMVLLVALMVALYFQAGPVITAIIGFLLSFSTVALHFKYKEFYRTKDRGQRTRCMIISMYVSCILTVACAYYYTLDTELTFDFAAIFLFGFFFFAFTVYRSLSRSMVVGDIQQGPRRR